VSCQYLSSARSRAHLLVRVVHRAGWRSVMAAVRCRYKGAPEPGQQWLPAVALILEIPVIQPGQRVPVGTYSYVRQGPSGARRGPPTSPS
jgi:hypothetical protein